MTPNQLLQSAYAHSHRASDIATQSWVSCSQHQKLDANDLRAWKENLIYAASNVTELERLARGGVEPKRG